MPADPDLSRVLAGELHAPCRKTQGGAGERKTSVFVIK